VVTDGIVALAQQLLSKRSHRKKHRMITLVFMTNPQRVVSGSTKLRTRKRLLAGVGLRWVLDLRRYRFNHRNQPARVIRSVKPYDAYRPRSVVSSKKLEELLSAIELSERPPVVR
jgi:hypothetical protein